MTWTAERQTIPARGPASARLREGQELRVINSHGSQVVDTWAFIATDPREHMSMEHSRVATGRLIPQPGDVLVSNLRKPMLEIIEDSSGGPHDTFCAACDPARYRSLGHDGHHDNCDDNLHAELQRLGLETAAREIRTPCPLNLFQNVPPRPDGRMIIEPPRARQGGWIALRACCDVVVVFSACSMDLADTNGAERRTTEAHFEVGPTP